VAAELPPALAEALDDALADISPQDLHRASTRLSERYREQRPRGGPVARTDADIRAYAATRMPATYAAITASLEAVRVQRAGWQPRSLLDLGAGPGTGLWAAAGVWPGLVEATALEAEAGMLALGRRLAQAAPATLGTVRDVRWERASLPAALPGGPFDVVLLAYLLGELRPDDRDRVVDAAAQVTADPDGVTVIVEPGTPDGYARVVRARSRLIAGGGFVTAPCPHDGPCPIPENDWCHFSVRLPRSVAHRSAKQAALGYEDEKFAYVAVARRPTARADARIVRHPQTRPRVIDLELCTRDGLRTSTVTKSDRERFRLARKARWGDAYPTEERRQPQD
jgi:ribosomal protein RSM22 (predicted rRNA methylase)